jgi:hypothetical protein
MLIERYVPTYDVRDYHEARVTAPAKAAYAVLRSLDLNRSWIVQALFAIRSLPGRLLGRTPPPLPSGTFLEQTLAIGWVVLEEAPGRELVAGAVTQPWKPVVTFQGLPPAEFMRFSQPGFTKIVWAIAARPVTPDVSVMSMETRVLATDAASRRKFRLYWFFVSPGVRLLRLVALHLARRELAQASAQGKNG